MEDLKLGIDDAGRGPVIGPMILAGCLIDEETERYFRKIGVKDSKLVTQKRREILEKEIMEKAKDFKVIICFPEEIEKTNAEGIKLNELEADHFAQVINKINKNKERLKVVVDCPSPGIEKWKDYLKTKIKNLSNLELSAEHKADKNHISVAAASILAKCERERQVKKLKEEYGDEIGSGYSSDPSTKKFLAKYALKYKDKGIFRKTWITWKNAVEKLNQEKLDF